MPEMKTVTLLDFLTPLQVRTCEALYPDRERIRDEVIAPNMKTIDRRLGQKNDPDYLSYAVIYVIGEVRRRSLS